MLKIGGVQKARSNLVSKENKKEGKNHVSKKSYFKIQYFSKYMVHD